jgi:Glycosyl hydrolases family 15
MKDTSSFWLADNYTLQNRDAEASALFDRLLSLRNDVGLLAEEYDPQAQRQVGNFPQAFSHLALIGTALNLHDIGPAQQRGHGATLKRHSLVRERHTSLRNRAPRTSRQAKAG